MLKFLFKTDTHGTAKTPSGRLDYYPLAILKKLYEVGKIIKEEKVDFVVDGGDLFHSAKISLKFAGEMARIMKSWGVPIYVIPGSHDVYDYNYQNIDNTMLGMFEKSGVVKVLTKGEPLEIDVDGYNLVIEGQEHLNKLTSDKSNIFEMTTLGDLNILVVHDMLVDKPMPKDVEQYVLKNIVTDADIVLSGHYHPGHGIKEYNNVFFYNPGSFGRVEYRDTKPQVIVFDVEADNGELVWTDKFIELKSAKESSELFDLSLKDKVNDSKNVMENFKRTLKATQSFKSNTTIDEMLEDIANENNIEQCIIDMANDYVSKARQNDDEKDLSIKGFVEKPYKLYITDVEIENFQSHEDTKVSFVDGLNALVGESNEGKTAILRAIKWALTNEPKGTAFITTGQSHVRVRVYFSDKTYVERERTEKDAGVFRVKKVNGDIDEYAGFNNEVPIDVINTHQMPEVLLSKDIKTVLNIQDQLEGPFFLKESPANKAAIIGRLIGVQHIDTAIKEVSRDMLSYQRDAKKIDSDIKEFEKDLKKYENLKDMELIINHVNTLMDKKDKLEVEKNKYTALDAEITGVRKDIETLEKYLKKLPDEKEISKKIEYVNELYGYLKVLNGFDEELTNVRNTKNKYEKILKNIPDIDFDKVLKVLSEKIAKAETLIALREERLSYYREQKRHEEVINKFDYLEDVLKAYNYLIKGLEEAENLIKLDNEYFTAHNEVSISQIRITKDLKEYNEALKEAENLERNLNQYLTEVGYCPLCGGTLSSEHMEHIIKG